MLVLTRRVGEQIFLDQGRIKIKVLFVRKGNVAIGIQAPPHMDIDREEIYYSKQDNPENMQLNPLNTKSKPEALLQNDMLKFLLFSSLSYLALVSQAANVTQVNRYATVANKPLDAQINPLLAVQQIHFPHHIQTLGQAVEWWLQYSVFKLVAKDKQSKNLQEILSQPLPQVDRIL